MALFDQPGEQLERRANVGRWEIVRASFEEANADLVIRHRLVTPDPEQVTYQVLNTTGPATLYHDGSATRSAWGPGFVKLRSSVAPVVMDIMLQVVAAPIGTTKLPMGAATIPGINADTLDGLDSTAFARNAFKTIVVAGESDIEADSPTDTLTLVEGSGITITTTPGSDTITISGASLITELDDIPDVNAPSPNDGEVLTWDSTPGEWVSAPAAAGASALDDLTDVVITTPADGEVLTYDSGSGDWINAAPTGSGGGAGGALVLLGEYVASSSASLDITTRNAAGMTGAIFQSDYDVYQFEFVNVVPATDDTYFRMRMSTNGGSSYDSGANYRYVGYIHTNAGAGWWNASGASYIAMHYEGPAGIDNNSNFGFCGWYQLYNPLSTAHYKMTKGSCSYLVDDGFGGDIPSGLYTSTTAVNAVQFYMASGNIASGTIRVYGLAKTNNPSSIALGDLLDVTAPSPTTGDILVWNGSAWVNSTLTPPGLVLLESRVASSSSELDFTTRNAPGQSGDTFQSDYDEYEIHFVNLLVSTNAVELRMRFSANSGSSFDTGNNYSSANFAWVYFATGANGHSGGAYLSLAPSIELVSGDYTVNGRLRVYGPLASTYTTLEGSWSYRHTDRNGTDVMGVTSAHTHNVSSAQDAFRVYPSSGTITSGAVLVYGITK